MGWYERLFRKQNSTSRTLTDDERQQKRERESVARRLRLLQMELEVMQRRSE